jgi:hypothetical protein
MTVQTVHMKQHDLLPQLQATLTSTDPITGVVSNVNLSTATLINFYMKNAISGLKVSALAVRAVDQSVDTGQVTYTWQGTDTDTAGKFQGEFEVVWASGKRETFPNDSYFIINIHADLGNA